MRTELGKERLLTFAEAMRHPLLAKRRNGSRINASTLWRWHARGIRGVRLETLVVGGIKMTSEEALYRFCEQVTEARASRTPPEPAALATRRTRLKRLRQSRADEEALK